MRSSGVRVFRCEGRGTCSGVRVFRCAGRGTCSGVRVEVHVQV